MLQVRTHQLVIGVRKTLAHHASTVLPLKNGHVLVAWFGGIHELTKAKIAWTAMEGFIICRTIVLKVRNSLQPSTRAASTIE